MARHIGIRRLLVGATLAGKVTPVIDRTYPLSDVPAAIRYPRKDTPGAKDVITV